MADPGPEALAPLAPISPLAPIPGAVPERLPEEGRQPLLARCRSMLNTCGLEPQRFRRAFEIGADIACLDLEDSVPPARREEARRLVLPFLAGEPEQAGFTWALRINSLHTADGLRDLLALLDSGAQPGALVIPKVESAAGIHLYEDLLGAALPRMAFLPVIETARGLQAADEIAAASPRVCALIFGSADFSADLGSTLDWEPLAYARGRIAVAAARAGIAAMDAPCFELRDDRQLRHDVERAWRLGYVGKVAVHPRQVAEIHRGFTPDSAAVALAQEILAANERSHGEICVVGGKMIGPPLVASARRLLARAGVPS